jgi:hypothetical protein
MSIGYKPVLPSSILAGRGPMDMNFSKSLGNNTSLRLGVVVDIIEIEDERNLSKLMPEYDVMVIENDNTSIYKHCMSFDTFGGVGDYFTAKLRKPKDPKKVKKSSSLKKQNGSIVLLLCIDGSSEQGIIVGAIAHPDRKNGKLTKAKGHHMEGEFNGINWAIDKDGALTVTFKSATDNDAKPQNAKAGGSTIKMEKDGSIQASDGNKETIRIDKTKKTISMTAESDISATTDANANITAKKNINAKATANLLAEAGGSATMKSGGAFDINAGGAFSVKAPSVNINSDGAAMVKASSVNLNAPSVMVGPGGSPAVTLSTQFMGIGNLGMPVISVAIGPFSGSVFVGA